MATNVDNMTDEEFEASYAEMLNGGGDDKTPENDDTITTEPPETEPEPEPGPDEEELDEEEVEQPEAADADEPEEEGTPSDDEPAADETEDSTEPDEAREPFDFTSIPMDEIIPMEIPANGMKVKATFNELVEGFKKGMNYTQKMQEIKPHRKSISIMRDNGLSETDLNLLVEAKGGSKEALSKLLSDAKIDSFDLDTEAHKEYAPEDHGSAEPDLEMEQVRTAILSDTEYKDSVDNALQTMPDDMYGLVSTEAGNLDALYKDIREGVYQEVMPEVRKIQALYGTNEPTLDTYIKVARTLAERKAATATVPKQSNAELQAKRKKVATSARSASPATKEVEQDLDALDDDAFEIAFKKMTGRSTTDYK